MPADDDVIELLSRAVHAPIRTLITRMYFITLTHFEINIDMTAVPFIIAIVCATRCTGSTSKLNSASR